MARERVAALSWEAGAPRSPEGGLLVPGGTASSPPGAFPRAPSGGGAAGGLEAGLQIMDEIPNALLCPSRRCHPLPSREGLALCSLCAEEE